MNDEIKNGKGLIEQTFTAMLGAAAGILVTYVTSIMGHNEALARIDQRLLHLESTIQQGMDDRYRAKDAKADFRIRDIQIEENSLHIEELQRYHRGVGATD